MVTPLRKWMGNIAEITVREALSLIPELGGCTHLGQGGMWGPTTNYTSGARYATNVADCDKRYFDS